MNRLDGVGSSVSSGAGWLVCAAVISALACGGDDTGGAGAGGADAGGSGSGGAGGDGDGDGDAGPEPGSCDDGCHPDPSCEDTASCSCLCGGGIEPVRSVLLDRAPVDVAVAPDGRVFMLFATEPFIRAFDAAGAPVAEAMGDLAWAKAIAATEDGELIVVGQVGDAAEAATRIDRLSSSLAEVWTRGHDREGRDGAVDVAAAPDGSMRVLVQARFGEVPTLPVPATPTTRGWTVATLDPEDGTLTDLTVTVPSLAVLEGELDGTLALTTPTQLAVALDGHVGLAGGFSALASTYGWLGLMSPDGAFIASYTHGGTDPACPSVAFEPSGIMLGACARREDPSNILVQRVRLAAGVPPDESLVAADARTFYTAAAATADGTLIAVTRNHSEEPRGVGLLYRYDARHQLILEQSIGSTITHVAARAQRLAVTMVEEGAHTLALFELEPYEVEVQPGGSACEANAECASGACCKTEPGALEGTCSAADVSSCQTGAVCTTSAGCVSGACSADPAFGFGGPGFCVATCDAATACASGEQCVAPSCEDASCPSLCLRDCALGGHSGCRDALTPAHWCRPALTPAGDEVQACIVPAPGGPALCEAQAECEQGVCTDNECVLQAKGAACEADSWCANGHCIEGECNGTSREGAGCSADLDCVTGTCCRGANNSGTCVPHGMGCGVIGSPCAEDNDCASGNCYGVFCTIECETSDECGDNPQSSTSPNHCTENDEGDRVCFPGCNNDLYVCGDYGAEVYCNPITEDADELICVF